MSSVKLSCISFPVYHLGKDAPIFEDGKHFYLMGRDINEPDGVLKEIVVDDKRLPQHSLAMRRLALREKGVELKALKKAIFYISDMVKLSNGATWFIDSEGMVFEYRKSTRVKLTFKPITQVIPIASGGAIIEVKGIPQRFKVLHTPKMEEAKAAGLLFFKGMYILFGLYDQVYDDTIRMI